MILFDICGLLDSSSEDCVGLFLLDGTELSLAIEVALKVDMVLQSMGRNRSDQEYIESAEWPAVIEAANRFLAYSSKLN
jgi:hypothetical protein